MEEKFCQSCGMPLGSEGEMCGSNEDGTKNEDYCKYCYEKGIFTEDVDMNTMIERCVAPMVESNPEMTEEKARSMMQEFFPVLKRWRSE